MENLAYRFSMHSPAVENEASFIFGLWVSALSIHTMHSVIHSLANGKSLIYAILSELSTLSTGFPQLSSTCFPLLRGILSPAKHGTFGVLWIYPQLLNCIFMHKNDDWIVLSLSESVANRPFRAMLLLQMQEIALLPSKLSGAQVIHRHKKRPAPYAGSRPGEAKSDEVVPHAGMRNLPFPTRTNCVVCLETHVFSFPFLLFGRVALGCRPDLRRGFTPAPHKGHRPLTPFRWRGPLGGG
ncbi:MAG: hypothetical protein ACI4MJ_06480 [Aristaeellaceae bacterium]